MLHLMFALAISLSPMQGDQSFASARTYAIPFTMPDGHIHVPMHVNGRTYDFLFDTGGAGLIMPQVAKDLNLPVIGHALLGGAGGGTVDTAIVQARSADLGGAPMPVPHFLVISGATAAGAGEFDGVIGREYFANYAIGIDYTHQVLTLTPLASFVPPRGVTPVPLTLRMGFLPNIPASVDGHEGTFDLDTGGPYGLTLTKSFVNADHLLGDFAAHRPVFLGVGAGGDVMGTVGRAISLTIGTFTIQRPVAAAAEPEGVFAQETFSGNIGPDVLKRFAVTLDIPARAAYFVPNNTINAPMPFNRAGLFVKHISGDVFDARLVWENSPAREAGISMGDQIISIDGQRPTGARLRTVFLQPAGTPVTVVFKHKETTLTRTLALRDLL